MRGLHSRAAGSRRWVFVGRFSGPRERPCLAASPDARTVGAERRGRREFRAHAPRHSKHLREALAGPGAVKGVGFGLRRAPLFFARRGAKPGVGHRRGAPLTAPGPAFSLARHSRMARSVCPVAGDDAAVGPCGCPGWPLGRSGVTAVTLSAGRRSRMGLPGADSLGRV